MLTPMQFNAMTIRPSGDADRARLDDLAQLDSARPLAGEALLAEVEGRPVAALEIGSGRAVADPVTMTSPIVDLLRRRAAQLL